MEKEQILSTLTEQLGQTSLSERTIGDYISAHLPEEGKEFDFEKAAGFLKSLNGNFSKSVADTVTRQVEDFKKNYKPETKEKPESEKNEEKGIIQTLVDKISALESKVNESERKNHSDSIRDKVAGMGLSFRVSNKALWKDMVAAAEIKNDDSADSVAAKVKSAYERKLKEYFGDGATPYGGSGSGGTKIVSPDDAKQRREAFKKKMKSQGRL